MTRHGKENGHSARRVSFPNRPVWHPCPECGKRTYPSRKDARRVARQIQGSGPRQSAYECAPDTGRWHTGHLAPAVIYGHTTRQDIYAERYAA